MDKKDYVNKVEDMIETGIQDTSALKMPPIRIYIISKHSCTIISELTNNTKKWDLLATNLDDFLPLQKLINSTTTTTLL